MSRGGVAIENVQIGSVKAAAAWDASGRLIDLILDDRASIGPRFGDIFWARIERAFPGGAAMASLGAAGRGYLSDAGDRTSGDGLIVAVRTPPDGEKAARISARWELSGPLATLTPGAPGVNVSRKVEAASKALLKKTLADAGLAEGDGLVLRTSAADAPPADVRQCVDALIAEASDLRAAAHGAPDLLRAGPTPEARLGDAYRQAPRPGDPDRLLEALAAFLPCRVALDGPDLNGAWMTVEPTEALIAVDVNPAGGAPLAANRAALQRLPCELRVRGLAGLICVDLAPFGDADGERLIRAIKADADPGLSVAGFGPIGLLEATRRKDRPRLADLAQKLGLSGPKSDAGGAARPARERR